MGIEAWTENAESAKEMAAQADGEGSESPRLPTARDESKRAETGAGAVSDTDLERAIVEAVLRGLDETARTLAAQLDARRRGGNGGANVIDLGKARERRR
jgi:hypothetical protein